MKQLHTDLVGLNGNLPIAEKVSRRQVMKSFGGAAAGIAMLSVTPLSSRAELAEFRERLAETINTKFGVKSIQEGRVLLELPLRADTGLSVPATISVPDSPMTTEDHVKSMHIITELNPQLEVADFYLGPMSGRSEVSTRIRLAQTQNVFAVAALSDNSLWATSVKVTVTLGACAAEIFLPDEKETLRQRLRERAGEGVKKEDGCGC